MNTDTYLAGTEKVYRYKDVDYKKNLMSMRVSNWLEKLDWLNKKVDSFDFLERKL